MKPGYPEKIEHSYERHGTLTLIANLEVGSGRIINPTIGPTRTELDFVNHIKQTVSDDGKWIFVLDQLNTHKSESLVKYVAAECGIDENQLGVKGKIGILKSMETRKDFLESPEHSIQFVYTPKHTSWLNQIEIWFGTLTKKLLRRGSFKSLKELKDRILEFIEHFNETMAKVFKLFKWTYSGRVLQS